MLDAVNRVEHEAEKDFHRANVTGGQATPPRLRIEAAGPILARTGPASRLDTVASFLLLATLVTSLGDAYPLCSRQGFVHIAIVILDTFLSFIVCHLGL